MFEPVKQVAEVSALSRGESCDGGVVGAGAGPQLPASALDCEPHRPHSTIPS